jgi:hypothetical protein
MSRFFPYIQKPPVSSTFRRQRGPFFIRAGRLFFILFVRFCSIPTPCAFHVPGLAFRERRGVRNVRLGAVRCANVR